MGRALGLSRDLPDGRRTRAVVSVTTHPFLIVCAAIALAVLLWVAAVFAVVLATDTIVWQALDYLLTTAGA